MGRKGWLRFLVRGWKGERLEDWEQRGLGKREVGGPMGMDTEWEDFCKAHLYSPASIYHRKGRMTRPVDISQSLIG